MAVSFSWLDSNFNLIQTAGILGSLWLGIAAAHREAKAREIQNLLALSEHHRELWTTMSQRQDLERILRACQRTVKTGQLGSNENQPL